MPPREQRFDVAATNQLTEQIFGYPMFAYWEFFTADDATRIINENTEQLWEVMHGDVDEWMKQMFCVPGAMKKHLLSDDHVPLKPYAQDPKWKKDFLDRFRKDGFEEQVQWYKAAVDNHHWESDRTIRKEVVTVHVPMLFIGCTGDAVCRTELIEAPRTAGLLPDLEVQVIEAGHWCAMEKPDEISKHVRNFLNKRFSPSTTL